MEDKDLKTMVATLTAEDEALTEEIRAAEVRRTKVRSILGLLQSLDSETAPSFDGKLVDAIRTVLRQYADRSMAPTEVRDAVKALGYTHPTESNLMAAIHGVLKRLVESRDARQKPGKDGSTRYQWLGANERTQTTIVHVPDRLPNSGLYNFNNQIPERMQTVINNLESFARIANKIDLSAFDKLATDGDAITSAITKLSEALPTVLPPKK